MLWQFLVLLIVHWLADFVLQTHWQASNKSKRNDALAAHVLMYTAILGIATAVIFPANWHAALFVAVNGVLHFATDWCTSRITSKLFMKQFQNLDVHGAEYWIFRPNFTLHNFFIVVGVDQLIHQLTLAGTMTLFFGGQ